MLFTLDKPIYLSIFLLIPFIWLMMRRSSAEASLSKQQLVVCALRSSLIIVLGFALSNPKHLSHSDQVNVFFCLDVSESIAGDQRQKAEAFIEQAVTGMQKEDQAGLIVFGKHPSLEVSMRTQLDALDIKSIVNPHNTNIHDALQLAIGRLPRPGKNKIVVFSDGNENLQRSRDMAYLAGSLGIEIYPVPLATWFGKNEAFVKSMQTPSDVALEMPFEIRLVVVSSVKNSGELVMVRNGNLLVQQPITLNAGTNLITLADTLSEPGLYLYKAVVNFSDDTFFQNNEGLSFTKGTRKARILYLTDKAPNSNHLIEALQAQGLDIDLKPIKNIPGALHGFVDYNAIILDNVSGRSISFSTMEQIERYVKDTGGGLIMLGGDTSFGAGYYKKTPVEKALPVFMDTPTDIKLSEINLVFVIDKSSSMTASYKNKSKLEMAKIASFASIEMLNPIDSVGIVTFDTEFNWTVPLTTANERQKIAENLSRIMEGGGTDLYPALKDVQRVLDQITSGRKHVIVLSDGETEEADFQSLVQSMRASGITISTVSIGQGANIKLMRSIAEWGMGRAYYTDDPNRIPKIFTSETKIISKKTITEKPMQPVVKVSDEILHGLVTVKLPAVYGQVITYPKPGSRLLIETEQGPLLAAWQYGLGRSVAFTSDLSNRWGKDWVKWKHYSTFASQMVKWVQRKETGKQFTAAIDSTGKKRNFLVDVTTDQNRFVNYLALNANVLLPSGKDYTLAMEQIAPGRYAGTFPAEEIGAYYFSVYSNSGDIAATPQTFGFGIPYTEEFNNTAVNEDLLEDLAATTSGKVLSMDNPPVGLFKDKSAAKQSEPPLWPYLILIFLLLLIADVAARKLLT
jgi:uncharacterized membrane protein/Mg-chelatase subunit ChlD